MATYREIVEKIPSHLKRYVVDQNYARYTPVDQAVWRYILRQLKDFLSKNAHPCYSEGLEKTGIEVDRIPHIDRMSEKLQEFGWVAVPVSGFIPPAAFMEMQSLGILPIASDMRTLDHLLYTPAPDIVHEAAGHAPILIQPEFANYLKRYAQVAKRAIIGKQDLQQYEAIRILSDLKEDPTSTSEQIAEAEQQLDKVNHSITHISEAALLGRMNWWTAEYGLIGPLDQPKIFGAGLLSSVGEARECLKPHVKKIPVSIKCVDYAYDITEMQPQLFVTESFEQLGVILDEFAETMAFRRGGKVGLDRAIQAETVNTVQLNSGIQISGQLKSYFTHPEDINQPAYLQFTGPCQLSYKETQLHGHGRDHHPQGFGCPVDRLQGQNRCLSQLSLEELEQLGVREGNVLDWTFSSGVRLTGQIRVLVFSPERTLLLITFEDCRVWQEEQTLFDPSWGVYDMAVGSSIPSVFGGPADREAYGETDDFVAKVIPLKKYSDHEKRRHRLYQTVRDLREKGAQGIDLAGEIRSLFDEGREHFPQDWLLFIEMLEILETSGTGTSLKSDLYTYLDKLKGGSSKAKPLIDDALRLVSRAQV